ncbi:MULTISPECIES: AmiS/UreI family transporter [Exiguobacterium]|uniref:AmiS/UreI family transporter n=1 Tax=Exiguobacterium TaxID=33986 RepID=UPI000494659D|nr:MULTISPECIES: AmiS/UreI family transporter [Exiguobacterium]
MSVCYLGGVALFLNSLTLFGKVDLRSAGVFSLITGLLQTFIATYLVIGAAGDPALTFGYASIYLFAFTYVYVGITFLFNLDGSGVGWFSLFVAIAALFYAFVSFTTNDIIGGVTWLFWALLWSLFFLGMGMNRPIDAITARVALVLSWLTLIAPALIGLRFGYFSSAYQWLWSGAAILTVVYFLYTMMKFSMLRTIRSS